VNAEKVDVAPLVIPLPPPLRSKVVSKAPEGALGPSEGKEKTLDELAAEELLAEAVGNDLLRSGPALTIPTAGTSIQQTKDGKAAPLLLANLPEELLGLNDDDQRFKVDISLRAEDISVKSDAYVNVPIEEFGAALLRGMGWTGPSEEDKEREKKSQEPLFARENRQGLDTI
jgi:hypothetical protein